jgi:hypothetical protein
MAHTLLLIDRGAPPGAPVSFGRSRRGTQDPMTPHPLPPTPAPPMPDPAPPTPAPDPQPLPPDPNPLPI